MAGQAGPVSILTESAAEARAMFLFLGRTPTEREMADK
jgi:hypothetical protein